jgi:raffinose/stachyose/melibiose transport system substrate-binding protein
MVRHLSGFEGGLVKLVSARRSAPAGLPAAFRPAALVLVIAAVVAACGGPAPTPSPSPPPTPSPTATPTAAPSVTAARTTITWWHTYDTDPGKSIWQTAAQMYMADHPDVDVQIEIMDPDTLAKRILAVENSGEMPDLLDSPGGPFFADLARKGLFRDITDDVATWSDPARSDIYGMNVYTYQGRQYGAPWGVGITGFYYNKAFFARAGIEEPPATWSALLSAVDKLKATGVIPFAIAGRDEWPATNMWTYLMLREGGIDAVGQAALNGTWNTDTCARAGADLAALVARNPFQPGYLGATYAGQAALVGNRQAAMELTGEWGPAAERANSKDGNGIGDDLGWFPFPLADGGFGRSNDGVGSTSGIAIGRLATPEAVDFLHFLMGKQVMDEIGATRLGLPSASTAADSVADPVLRQLVATRSQGRSVQLYLNLVTSPQMTGAIEDAVALLLAGRATPAQTCQALAAASAAAGATGSP